VATPNHFFFVFDRRLAQALCSSFILLLKYKLHFRPAKSQTVVKPRLLAGNPPYFFTHSASWPGSEMIWYCHWLSLKYIHWSVTALSRLKPPVHVLIAIDKDHFHHSSASRGATGDRTHGPTPEMLGIYHTCRPKLDSESALLGLLSTDLATRASESASSPGLCRQRTWT